MLLNKFSTSIKLENDILPFNSSFCVSEENCFYEGDYNEALKRIRNINQKMINTEVILVLILGNLHIWNKCFKNGIISKNRNKKINNLLKDMYIPNSTSLSENFKYRNTVEYNPEKDINTIAFLNPCLNSIVNRINSLDTKESRIDFIKFVINNLEDWYKYIPVLKFLYLGNKIDYNFIYGKKFLLQKDKKICYRYCLALDDINLIKASMEFLNNDFDYNKVYVDNVIKARKLNELLKSNLKFAFIYNHDRIFMKTRVLYWIKNIVKHANEI